MHEGIPDINAVRAEKIKAVIRPIEEVCDHHLDTYYDSLVLNWLKKDNIRTFEFTVWKYPATSPESTEKALDEILEILQTTVQPELPDYTFTRSEKGVLVSRN